MPTFKKFDPGDEDQRKIAFLGLIGLSFLGLVLFVKKEKKTKKQKEKDFLDSISYYKK